MQYKIINKDKVDGKHICKQLPKNYRIVFGMIGPLDGKIYYKWILSKPEHSEVINFCPFCGIKLE